MLVEKGVQHEKLYGSQTDNHRLRHRLRWPKQRHTSCPAQQGLRRRHPA